MHLENNLAVQIPCSTSLKYFVQNSYDMSSPGCGFSVLYQYSFVNCKCKATLNKTRGVVEKLKGFLKKNLLIQMLDQLLVFKNSRLKFGKLW